MKNTTVDSEECCEELCVTIAEHGGLAEGYESCDSHVSSEVSTLPDIISPEQVIINTLFYL